MTLNVTVKKRIATYVSGQGIPVCGNTGDQVKFTFDEEWSQHETKTARFKWGGKVFDQEFTGNICEIPNIDNADFITVGVFVGEEEDGEEELSTTDTKIPYRRSTRCGNNIPHGESGESYTNLAKGYAVSAKADADRTEELLTEYIDDVDALIGGEGVEGGGSSSGGGTSSGGGIIDVAELPTENINEQSIYRLEKVGVPNVYICMDFDSDGAADALTLAEFFAMQGTSVDVKIYIVETLPETLQTPTETTLYTYVLESTGLVYCDQGGGAMTLGTLVGSAEMDKGWSDDISAETEQGIYSVAGKNDYTYHACKNGEWKELSDTNFVNDTIDNKTSECVRLLGTFTFALGEKEGEDTTNYTNAIYATETSALFDNTLSNKKFAIFTMGSHQAFCPFAAVNSNLRFEIMEYYQHGDIRINITSISTTIKMQSPTSEGLTAICNDMVSRGFTVSVYG